MFLSDLVNQTKSYLPLFTELFTTNVSITSISKSGDDVTVTAPSHGLVVGKQIVISGVKTEVVIDTIMFVQQIATATCATPHDLTVDFDKTVEIDSPESVFSGRFNLLSAPDQLTFTFSFTGTPAGPSTGTSKTFHNLGFNGPQEVSEVVDTDNFKYVLENDSLLVGSGSNMLVMKDSRITGIVNLDRADASYTKYGNNELWGFFVLEPTDTSNDRNVDNDSNNERQEGDDFKLRMIDNVVFYVFVPTSDQVGAVAAMDLTQILLRPIYKTLAAYLPEKVFSTKQQTLLMPDGHELTGYQAAFLIYAYRFQTTSFMEREGESDDPEEFMSNSGDTFPNSITIGLKNFNWKAENVKLNLVKDDNYEIQN